jgi:hypothetical protein
MSEFKSSNFRNEDGSGGPDIVGLTTMTSPYYFVPPSGTTAQRPSDPEPGMLRFNEDIGRLEVWRNDHWATILGEQSATNSGRAFFGGGYTQSGTPNSNAVEYATIQTTGNTVDFGDLTRSDQELTAFSSTTRGIWAGGDGTNVMDFITFTSTGNATNFGDLNELSTNAGSVSDSTRGVIATGGFPTSPGYKDTIDFVTMASAGNATDFGNLSQATSAARGVGNRTRGVFHLGGIAPASGNNTLEYVTIQSTGNSVDFGDLAQGGSNGARSLTGSFSNSVRGVFFGGTGPSSPSTTEQNCIQYITISSTGNSLDFGDLIVSRNRTSGTCDATRGLCGGGNPSSARNNIEFVTISTLGNSQDFGDFTVTLHSYYDGACSNAHGGL